MVVKPVPEPAYWRIAASEKCCKSEVEYVTISAICVQVAHRWGRFRQKSFYNRISRGAMGIQSGPYLGVK
jgi:hypothetical protein